MSNENPIHNRPYPSAIIKFVSWIIRSPKCIILIPILLLFMLAYNVLYDFTIKVVNSSLALHFGDFSINPVIDSKLYINQFRHDSSLEKLIDINRGIIDASGLSLTKVVVSSESDYNYNVLEYDFFAGFYHHQQQLEKNLPSAIILSPYTLWPLDFTAVSNTTLSSSDKLKVQNYISYYINFRLNTQLLTLFLDNLFKYNHLIRRALVLKYYVIHPSSEDISLSIPGWGKIISVDTVTSSASIMDFVQYFLIQTNSLWSASIFIFTSNIGELTLVAAFVIYIYLCIANQYKVRSSTGLLIGWVVEVLVSCCASVNIISMAHNYKSWRLVFDPLTTFTRAAYVLTVMVLSSRNLFRIINDIAGDNTFELSSDIHKRLFKYYLGINNSVKNSLRKLEFLASFFKYLGVKTEHVYVPNITKVLVINVFGIFVYLTLGISLFRFFFDGNFYSYLSMRLIRFIEACVLAVVLDHILQLTYLVGILIVDLNRVDLQDVLSKENDHEPAALYEVNILSRYLLKLNKPSHMRPARESKQFLLGQYLLKAGPSSLAMFWFVLLPAIQTLHFLGVFTNWVILIPYTLMNKESTVTIGHRNIVVNENSLIYYAELVIILVFILTSAQIAFHWTLNPEHTEAVAEKTLNKDDFELIGEIKNFKCIDLFDSTDGHTLDIFKLATNPVSSFLVSVGIDHKVVIWSPLSKEQLKPIDISTKMDLGEGKKREFWPINLIKISDDGRYVILFNFKHGLVKCFERDTLSFKWEIELPAEILDSFPNRKFKVLESFFRKKTVPGFLSRKILQQKKKLQKTLSSRPRRSSNASIMSAASAFNGNFPPPSAQESEIDRELSDLDKQLNKEEFMMVLKTGDLISISCEDGTITTSNIVSSVYEFDEPNASSDTINQTALTLNAAKKLTTARVSDRIVCNVSNNDIIVATAVNNKWKFRKLPLSDGTYNTGAKVLTPYSLSRANSFSGDRYAFQSKFAQEVQEVFETQPREYKPVNKADIVPIEFVGMVLRVVDLKAQLIDAHTGTILKSFNIGHFKPGTLKVSHSEPTHCKFCGCASVRSFSIMYQDFYDPTIILHTFQLESKKSKNNICLRVERDPREIRCLGFNAVLGKQYWYENVDKWELTDVNMIVAFRRKSSGEEQEIVPQSSSTRPSLEGLIENSGLMSLRSRKDDNRNRKLFSKSYLSIQKTPKLYNLNQIWDCLVITALDGKEHFYSMPNSEYTQGLVTNTIHSIAKYGFKSVAVSFGNAIKILYLGNDKLIEDDIYYSGTGAISSDILEDDQKPAPHPTTLAGTNPNELLFINKRRKMREKKHKLSAQ